MKIKGKIKTYMSHEQVAETKREIRDITNMLQGKGSSNGVGNFDFILARGRDSQ